MLQTINKVTTHVSAHKVMVGKYGTGQQWKKEEFEENNISTTETTLNNFETAIAPYSTQNNQRRKKKLLKRGKQNIQQKKKQIEKKKISDFQTQLSDKPQIQTNADEYGKTILQETLGNFTSTTHDINHSGQVGPRIPKKFTAPRKAQNIVPRVRYDPAIPRVVAVNAQGVQRQPFLQWLIRHPPACVHLKCGFDIRAGGGAGWKTAPPSKRWQLPAI